jgi:hypothetical protein
VAPFFEVTTFFSSLKFWTNRIDFLFVINSYSLV